MFDPAMKKGVGDAKFLAKSVAEIDRLQAEAEGDDEREYITDAVEVKKNK